MKVIKRRDFLSLLLTLTLFLLSDSAAAIGYSGESYKREVEPTKNVILMIPDGTSVGTLAATRWYNMQKSGEYYTLALDEHLCGYVRSFSSNALISDSAPSGSAYSTGMLSQAGNIAIYPAATENDLIDVDSTLKHQPLATLLEAARLQTGRSTGLVFKCEFPHATPASTSSHTPKRSDYPVIASQMAYQNIDVVFGGGNNYVSDDMANHFTNSGVSYYADDTEAFRKHTDGAVWALWGDNNLPFALDHDGVEIPYLDEMTGRAIELLSKNENGFFLMVEGSMVDWAAHNNDAIGAITEFDEFDRAVNIAIDFAKRDGNTTVVIAPDHSTGGFTLGNYELRGYATKSLDDLFGTAVAIKKTTGGVEGVLRETDPSDFERVFMELTGIELSEDELTELIAHREGEIPENYMEIGYSENLATAIREIFEGHTPFGFCSYGHTGEDVFLGAYHPKNQLPYGANTIMDVNHYMADALGLKEGERLPDLTKEYFVKHTDLFADMKCEIVREEGEFPILKVKNGRRKVEFPAYKSIAIIKGEREEIGSLVVYMESNDTFYLPLKSRGLLTD